MGSWAAVEQGLRRGADHWAQHQTYNSLRKKVQMAAAREKSAALAAEEEAQLAATLALSAAEAAAERQLDQWVEPSWMVREQQLLQQTSYAAVAGHAEEGPAAATPTAGGIPESPWGLSSSNDSAWGSAAVTVGAAANEGTVPAGDDGSGAVGSTGGYQAAAPAPWTVMDSPLPASGISSSVPSAASVLPVVPEAQLAAARHKSVFQGFNAAAAAQAAGAPVVSTVVLPAVTGTPALQAQHAQFIQPGTMAQQQQQQPGYAAPPGLVSAAPPGFGPPGPAVAPPPGFAAPFSHGGAAIAFNNGPTSTAAALLSLPMQQPTLTAIRPPSYVAPAAFDASSSAQAEVSDEEDLEEMLGLLGV